MLVIVTSKILVLMTVIYFSFPEIYLANILPKNVLKIMLKNLLGKIFNI